MIRLIDIIEILSDHHKIKIGLDGDYMGTFDKDDIKYYFLQQEVKAIYPMTNDGDKTRMYICIDLVTNY